MHEINDLEVIEDLFIIKEIMDIQTSDIELQNIFKRRKKQKFKESSWNIYTDKNPIVFFESTRMSYDQFKSLLILLEPLLNKRSHRKPIKPEQRLYITLNFLAHGFSLRDMSDKFKIGLETARSIILETCNVLWNALAELFVKKPDENGWKSIANEFLEETGLPHCVGVVDGKHIKIHYSSKSNEQCFKYKKFKSIVLLAACDCNYSFTLVDIEPHAEPHIWVLDNSSFGHKFINSELNFPPDSCLPKTATMFPHYFLADEEFPLNAYIIKTFPKQINCLKKKYNAKVYQARRSIEKSFEILTAKWNILEGTLNFTPKNARKIILATIVLHNFLRKNAIDLPDSMCQEENHKLRSINCKNLNIPKEASQIELNNRTTLYSYLNT